MTQNKGKNTPSQHLKKVQGREGQLTVDHMKDHEGNQEITPFK